MKKFIGWVKDNPHSLSMLYLIIYLVTFFTLEHVTTPKFIIYSSLDDYIPFCEWFAPIYISWLVLFPLSLLFFLLYDKEDYQNLAFILMNGATVCFLCYIFLPTGLSLRVDITRDNVFANLMRLLWEIDTPTNVCPSLHVSVSTSIALVAFKSKKMKKTPVFKWAVIIWMLLICVSTVFVKQHSIIDVFCGAAVTAVLGAVAYHTDWKKFIAKTPFKFML